MEQVSIIVKKPFDHLKKVFGWSNPMEAYRVKSVVISVGVGRVNKDKSRMELIQDRLLRITGQTPVPCQAKKSIASFKVREGDLVGFKVTMRGERMLSFLDRFIHIALPRSRDFIGLEDKAVDDIGNLTIGLREHTIFPEVSDEEASNIFGLAITIITTATNKEEGEKFFRSIGVPFKKVDNENS